MAKSKRQLRDEYIERYPERNAAAVRKYRQSEKGKRATRNGMLKRNYGITLEQYEEMLITQSGVCYICHKPETRIPRGGKDKTPHLAVDHCHRTSKVRGLLCHACNASIGLMEENVDRLRAAALYLEKFNANL